MGKKSTSSIFGVKVFYLPTFLWKKKIQTKLLSEDTSITTLYTLNLEILSLAINDLKYAQIIRKGSWVTVDGITISILLFFKHFKIVHRICGSDLIYDLLDTCTKTKKSLAIIGGKPSSVEKATQIVQSKYPSLVFNAFSPIFPTPIAIEEYEDLALFIKKNRPDVLAVCLGAPKQELWIEKNKTFLEESGVKIVAGLGGTIDFLGKTIPRAPTLFRILGLEWLWRGILEPFRFKRYIKSAFIVFKYILKTTFLRKNNDTDK